MFLNKNLKYYPYMKCLFCELSNQINAIEGMSNVFNKNYLI